MQMQPEYNILKKHVIIVIETINQYQKERGLIFLDSKWDQIYMDSVQTQHELVYTLNDPQP
jgi:hypothetical protein